MTTRDDLVSRLSVDFRMMRTYDDPGGPFVRYADHATALEAANAEIARMTERQERMWCQACGTVTRTGACDCNRHDNREPSFVNYADRLQTDCQEALTRITDLERQLAEETERCARIADECAKDAETTVQTMCARVIAAAIRGGAK